MCFACHDREPYLLKVSYIKTKLGKRTRKIFLWLR